MRTTLVISDPVYRRAKRAARERGLQLSALITEATEDLLLRMEAGKGERRRPEVRLRSFAMGVPGVDINNRDELFRKMEE